MLDDFDEDTFETITSSEVISPIAELRRKKQIQENTFVISRENFEKSSNEQIEAWFTKFDQVIIDDTAQPYKDPLTKKELAKKIGLTLYSNLNKENMQKGIGMIQKGTDMISEFGKAFGPVNSNFKPSEPKRKTHFKTPKADTSFLTSKPKRNSLMIWSDEKKHQVKPKRKRKVKAQKEYNPLSSNKKITFSSSKKVRFF